jgi:MFS superfamily sulfate permease-like transporter
MKQISKKVPGALLAVAGAIIVSRALGLAAHIQVLGSVPGGLPHIALPAVPWSWTLGLANVGAGLSGTFVVNGSPTKTQMVESAGGRTQLSLLVMAVIVLLVLLFLTAPLAYLPEAALSGVVFLVGIDLIDIGSRRSLLCSGASSRASCSPSCCRSSITRGMVTGPRMSCSYPMRLASGMPSRSRPERRRCPDC